MRIIAVTTPKVTDDDAQIITRLLDVGVDVVHIRKPCSDVEECRLLLSTIGDDYLRRIVIHDHTELFAEFPLLGIHQNRSVQHLPDGYSGIRTRSCHTFEEIARYKQECDYLFLSPIFDSISKVGYRSHFSDEELRWAAREGIIDGRVIALGGVTFRHLDYLKSIGFGGAAMCGALYSLDAVIPIL